MPASIEQHRRIAEDLLAVFNSADAAALEEISFEGCKFITDAGIPFLTTLPPLREISIGGCPK